MHNLLTRGSWRLWNWDANKCVRRFESGLKNPQLAQTNYLQTIIEHADESLWAKEYGIHRGISLSEFRERVPVQEYQDISKWIQRIIYGEKRVLTNEQVERLVPTSGSTGDKKLIPMNLHSRYEFSTAVNLWILECMRKCPKMRSGTAYIATSPAIDVKVEASALPVGFARDTDYLGILEKVLLKQILAVPLSVAEKRGAVWRESTRRHLLQSNRISFLSLWHPDYLQALFSNRELSELAERWPKLSLISTWSDGSCSEPAQKLMSHFPQAAHMPKGLWLTEGVITVPWKDLCPVALTSGFYEFEDETGRVCGVEQLCDEKIYRPILTNHAGLYRYRLGDLVQVNGFVYNTPSLRWIGRSDDVVDLCGEKLNEAQISTALQAIDWQYFFVLIPIEGAPPPYYLCLLADTDIDAFPLQNFERLLQRNPHYTWARELGQLGALEIRALDSEQIDTVKRMVTLDSEPHLKKSFLVSRKCSQRVLKSLEPIIFN
ncbi:MAG: GH3 auxin-responsive promoter family protein [Verrucomicrobiota bacterium]